MYIVLNVVETVGDEKRFSNAGCHNNLGAATFGLANRGSRGLLDIFLEFVTGWPSHCGFAIASGRSGADSGCCATGASAGAMRGAAAGLSLAVGGRRVVLAFVTSTVP